MKNLIFTIVIILTSILGTNAQEETFNLTVNISGLNSDKGTLLIGVYNKKEDFLNKQFKGEISKIENKKSVVIFKNLPRGEYAVSFVHDENDNKKMDTNFLGIPVRRKQINQY